MKYPVALNIRLAVEDRDKLLKVSEAAEIPPATLVRRVLRQWLRNQSEFVDSDRTQSQATQSPAA